MSNEPQPITWILKPLLLIVGIGIVALAWALGSIPTWLACVLLPVAMYGLWTSVPSGADVGDE